MKPILHDVKLSVLEINSVAATILVGVKNQGKNFRAECFEVGVDGSKPESPLAIAAPDVSLRIGTPFLWSRESQPRYAVIVSDERDGRAECGEVQFGFDADGEIVVTEAFKPICFSVPAANLKLPSLFVVSDSTAFSNGKNQRGWGDELRQFFDPEKINVLNRARPGRSTRSFRSEGLWSRVLAELKAGDFVLIQFGHNDADKVGEGRCRGVLPGVGDEMQEIVLPDGATETVRTYGWYLRQFAAETKAKGATPILLSLTSKNVWRHGRVKRDQSAYGEWAAQIAEMSGVEFIDLTALIADRYDALGLEKVQPLFCNAADDVHTSAAGAKLNAECVVAGFAKLKNFPSEKMCLA